MLLAARRRTAQLFQRTARARRHESTSSTTNNSSTSADASPPSKSSTSSPSVLDSNYIQRPLAVLTAPFTAYGRAQSRRPNTTQLLSSLIIYTLGDLSSQYIGRPRTHKELEALQGSRQDTAKFKERLESKPKTTAPVPSPPPSSVGSSGDGDDANANRPSALDPASNAEDSPPVLHEYYDRSRTFRALIIGSISSLPSYHWHLYLSHHFNIPGSFVASLGVKILIQQLLFAPLFNSYFFGMQALLAPLPTSQAPSHSPSSAPNSASPSSSQSPERETLLNTEDLSAFTERKLSAAATRVRTAVPTAWLNSCMFWPMVTAFNFSIVPPRSRSVFAGLVAVGWQSWLGLVNVRAQKSEATSRLAAVSAPVAEAGKADAAKTAAGRERDAHNAGA